MGEASRDVGASSEVWGRGWGRPGEPEPKLHASGPAQGAGTSLLEARTAFLFLLTLLSLILPPVLNPRNNSVI